ncbi:alpha/beta hydrolase [Pontiella sp.]|uniref:alpha/beta hydrolase n=1 Tax=Pontiella sp. TaxID=2837462 RepID=UPI0035679CD6
MKRTVWMVLGALLPLLTAAADYRPTEKLLYKTAPDNKTGGKVELHLHLFKPDGLQASDKRPAIVFFFGGGWNGGDPKQFYQQADFFAKRGFVCFSAEYRVGSRNKATPFECVKDGKSAIRWVRAHAAELGVDPDRIVASGGSAGGHVAACTGIIQGCEEAGEKLAISSLPNAMILFNPVLDTTEKGYGANKFKPEQQTDLSPCHQVRSGIVPTLLMHGRADKTVPFENADRFARLMKASGNDCRLIPFEGQDHGFFNGPFFRPKTKDLTPYESCMAASAAFLSEMGFAAERTKSR